MFIRRRLDKLILPLMAIAAFCAVSYRPRFHLNPSMPREFADAASATTPQKRVSEERIAKAYWQCAVYDVQWKRGFGTPLPNDPPAEFALAPQVPGADTATRTRYWRRLQQAWYSPGVWKKDYQWDTSWTFDWVRNAGEWLHTALPSMGNGN
jgi:hypothetical protein